MTPSIVPRLLRTLDLRGGDPPHVSAASGLVVVKGHLYVVADDELAIGVFHHPGEVPGTLLPLAAGELPQDHEARKAVKPDCEALALVPASALLPHGALLALGSGSRPTRERGFVVPLDADGAVAEPPRSIDLAPLYSSWRARLGELNIEGAFFSAGGVTLLQRGNRSDRCNASLRFEAGPFVDWICGLGKPPMPTRITSFDLGDIDGVALAFTDGTALDADSGDFWIFSAAAEDTSDSYNDGACLGSVVGVVDGRNGRVVQQARLTTLCKVEGTALLGGAGDRRELLLVTDADDRSEPAKLLSCTLPAGAAWL